MLAYVSIRQHTSAYISTRVRQRRIRRHTLTGTWRLHALTCRNTSEYVSIRQHTSAYVSIRQHASAYAYVSIRQHTSAYVSIRIRQHTSPYVDRRLRNTPTLQRLHSSSNLHSYKKLLKPNRRSLLKSPWLKSETEGRGGPRASMRLNTWGSTYSSCAASCAACHRTKACHSTY
jgi:hypothetical protein